MLNILYTHLKQKSLKIRIRISFVVEMKLNFAKLFQKEESLAAFYILRPKSNLCSQKLFVSKGLGVLNALPRLVVRIKRTARSADRDVA